MFEAEFCWAASVTPGWLEVMALKVSALNMSDGVLAFAGAAVGEAAGVEICSAEETAELSDVAAGP